MTKALTTKPSKTQVVKDIRRVTRKLYSSEEKGRIVLSGLRGEDSIAAKTVSSKPLLFAVQSVP